MSPGGIAGVFGEQVDGERGGGSGSSANSGRHGRARGRRAEQFPRRSPSEGARRYGVRAHAGLSDVLGHGVHDGLMKVFDHSVVAAVDMDGDLGDLPSVSAVESRQGDSPQTVVSSPIAVRGGCWGTVLTRRWRSARHPVWTGHGADRRRNRGSPDRWRWR